MAKQLLHGTQIRAAVEQMAGKRVAKDMGRDAPRVKTGEDGKLLQFPGESLARQMARSRTALR